MTALPPGTLNDMAVIYHEMFTAFVKAGFSEDQALALLLSLLPNVGNRET